MFEKVVLQVAVEALIERAQRRDPVHRVGELQHVTFGKRDGIFGREIGFDNLLL